jgi:hypothetical protein
LVWAAGGSIALVTMWCVMRSAEHVTLNPKATEPSTTSAAAEVPAEPAQIRRAEEAIDQLSLMVDRAEFNFNSFPEVFETESDIEDWRKWAESWVEELNRFPMPEKPSQNAPYWVRETYREIEKTTREAGKLALPSKVPSGAPFWGERQARILIVRSQIETAKRALARIEHR